MIGWGGALALLAAPLVGLVATLATRFRASGMVQAMLAATFAQLLAGVVVWRAAPVPVTIATLALCCAWLVAAALFRGAARRQATGAAQG
ncbi:MAG: hypothetical protein U1F18_13665 [Steroidobacteraceae bacterium]|jgi:cytochrome c oxidase assembly factor CtaG